jgi:hypothetical protein
MPVPDVTTKRKRLLMVHMDGTVLLIGGISGAPYAAEVADRFSGTPCRNDFRDSGRNRSNGMYPNFPVLKIARHLSPCRSNRQPFLSPIFRERASLKNKIGDGLSSFDSGYTSICKARFPARSIHQSVGSTRQAGQGFSLTATVMPCRCAQLTERSGVLNMNTEYADYAQHPSLALVSPRGRMGISRFMR